MSNSHLVVVGSGIAGLYGALLAAESGVRVTLLTKGSLQQSNTHHAQGGICAVLAADEAAPGDSVEAHIADTIKAGAGQCDPDAVRILCTEAAGDIAALERFGVHFDRGPDGKHSLGLEGAHSAARILHAGGDATGAGIADGLIRAVLDAAALGTITILENCFATELLTREAPDRGSTDNFGTPSRPVITGLAYVAEGDERRVLAADAVLLATGGAGRLFEFTTNPAVATGDGVALAWAAGAVLADLEYFQFHPTALAVGENFLISEAVRGAGAVLRGASGEAFMAAFHPEGDLAPRDVVSRSIAAHLAAHPEQPGHVFLDATGVETAHGPGYLARRFPTIDAATAALGFDWRREPLPVAPAAHYWMGGVATDLDGRTTVPGLYAAGEVACTGVHGANRLASNSLLEGLVFSRRAVAAFTAAASSPVSAQPWPVMDDAATRLLLPPSRGAGPARDTLRHLMTTGAGVVRNAAGLLQAVKALAGNADKPDTREVPASPASVRQQHEDANVLLVARLLVHAAQARENSAGGHFRSDFPQPPTTPARASRFWVNIAPARPVTDLTIHEIQRESETV